MPDDVRRQGTTRARDGLHAPTVSLMGQARRPAAVAMTSAPARRGRLGGALRKKVNDRQCQNERECLPKQQRLPLIERNTPSAQKCGVRMAQVVEELRQFVVALRRVSI